MKMSRRPLVPYYTHKYRKTTHRTKHAKTAGEIINAKVLIDPGLCYTTHPMRSNRRFKGTLRAIHAHWPAYAFLYGGLILTLIVIAFSAERGWIGLILLNLAFFIVLIYFLLAALWHTYLQFDQAGLNPHHLLFDMAQLQATDTFVYIDLGLRYRALDMARRLTTGKVIVIDIYNPQWTPGRALIRQRARMPAPPPDPRISWQTGSINLLPLPDKSVTAVILCQVASEFSQKGDRQQLLKEINRILAENGRLLLAEQVRSRMNWILMGPSALALAPDTYWRNLLHQEGFRVRRETNLQGIIHCFRADKPTYTQAQQLSLSLGF